MKKSASNEEVIVKGLPSGNNKNVLEPTAFRGIVSSDALVAFKKLLGFTEDGENTKSFLDKIKSIRMEIKRNGGGDQSTKEFSILEFAFRAGCKDIANFILEQVDSSVCLKGDEDMLILDSITIQDFVPNTLFANPISDNATISADKEIKIKLLKLAIKMKNPQAVASVVAQLEEEMDAKNYSDCIEAALKIGDFNLLNSLINNKIAKRLQYDIFPLHRICDANQDFAPIVDRLRQDLDINLLDPQGNTPLHIAVARKHKHSVGKMAQSANLNIKNSDFLKPIEIAARNNDFGLVKQLYEAGADIYPCFNMVQNMDIPSKETLLEKMNCLLKKNNPVNSPKAEKSPENLFAKEQQEATLKPKYEYLAFKGGGIRGLAYLAAILESKRQRLIDLDKIKGFAGTSAGSITACLLALRLPMERLEDIIKNKNFTDFFDYHNKALVDDIIKKLENGVGIWTILTNYWTITQAKTMLDTELGICKGENFYQWIKGLIGEAIVNTPLSKKDPENITFRDLHDFPEFFKDLVVYGSNVNTGFSERYSYETTPDMCIADAIRISMSIPILFNPHKKYVFKDGKRQLATKIIIEKGVEKEVEDHDLCVDGGLFNNYPVGAFDLSELGEYLFNELMLGYCLVEPDEHEQFEFGKSRQGVKIEEGSAIRYLFSLIYSTLFNQQAVEHQKGFDRNRTVYINTRGINTADFGLSDENKEVLYKEGRDGVIHFVARQHNLPEKKLSSEVAKKLFSLGFLCTDEGVVRLEKSKIPTVDRILKLYACASDDELAYLKTIVNPNFMENGVTPLQVARAYGYKKLEARLLQCNANPDVETLSMDEVKKRISVSRLVDIKNESLVMMTKKQRLNYALERFQESSKVAEETHKKLVAIVERKTDEKIATKNSELSDAQSRYQHHLAYITCRSSYEKKLRDTIKNLKKVKDGYINLSTSYWLKQTGRQAAENHWNYWDDHCADLIVEDFLKRCPDDGLKSDKEVLVSYCESLGYLLTQLESKPLMDIISASGTDESSYRHHVQRYLKQVLEQKEELELKLSPRSRPPAYLPSQPLAQPILAEGGGSVLKNSSGSEDIDQKQHLGQQFF